MWHTVNADGTLQHLFWCDGVSRMDYLVFDDVLAFDATYRKIKYSTSLVIFSGVNHHNQSVIFGSAIVGDETEDAYGKKTPGVGYNRWRFRNEKCNN
jgi:hypothetical protein